MDISHIVTIGCSFTYCQGLPIFQGWPALVANALDCPLVNLGIPGVGNDNIHRRLYEYIYNDLLIYNSKPLVIIAWTQPWRRETWSKKHYNDEYFQNYAPMSLPDTSEIDAVQTAFLENYNEEDFHRRTVLAKTSVINLLKQFNIPYIMTDAMPQNLDDDRSEEHTSELQSH